MFGMSMVVCFLCSLQAVAKVEVASQIDAIEERGGKVAVIA